MSNLAGVSLFFSEIRRVVPALPVCLPLLKEVRCFGGAVVFSSGAFWAAAAVGSGTADIILKGKKKKNRSETDKYTVNKCVSGVRAAKYALKVLFFFFFFLQHRRNNTPARREKTVRAPLLDLIIMAQQ
jgi:hypothetical protein